MTGLTKALVASAVFAATTAAPPLIASQDASASVCGTHEHVTQLLAGRYKEARRAVGVVANEGVMEVFVSSDGTWSIILTSTKGLACIIAAGKNWEEVKAKLPDPAA